MKASGAPAALQQRLPPAVATAVRDCEALATSDKASPGAYLRVPIASSKLDRHGLEGHLPAALEFVSGHLAQQRRVLLHCDAGMNESDAALCGTCFMECYARIV